MLDVISIVIYFFLMILQTKCIGQYTQHCRDEHIPATEATRKFSLQVILVFNLGLIPDNLVAN